MVPFSKLNEVFQGLPFKLESFFPLFAFKSSHLLLVIVIMPQKGLNLDNHSPNHTRHPQRSFCLFSYRLIDASFYFSGPLSLVYPHLQIDCYEFSLSLLV